MLGGCKLRKQLAVKLRLITENLVNCKIEDFSNFKPHLGCLCAICSTALKDIFEEHGFKAEVFYGKFRGTKNHCWVECDGYIYDITATQFKGIEEPVIVTRKTSKKAQSLFQMGRAMKNYKDYKGWPHQQKPRKRVIDRLLTEIQYAS
jgi:hypothetical protein